MRMNQKLFWLVAASCFVTGCALDEAKKYGDACEKWVAVINQNGPECTGSSCSQEYKSARADGFCPSGYVCALNDKKETICRTPCDSSLQQCNDQCLPKNDYDFFSEKVGDLEYCKKCPKSCLNGCADDGKCACDAKCPGQCDEKGACLSGAICRDGDKQCDDDGKKLLECRDNAWKPSETCERGCSNNQCHACDGDAVQCANDNITLQKCENHQWTTLETCVNGCGEAACFACTNDTYQCSEDEKTRQKCENHAWIDADKCQNGCRNGECLPDVALIVSEKNIRLLNGRADLTQPVKIEYLVNAVKTEIDLKIEPADKKCVAITDTPKSDKSYELTFEPYPGTDHCETSIKITAGELTETIDVRVFGATEDANGNHLLDYYETASKQGQDCRKYADCDVIERKELGFCDSFIGYKCSTKCTADDQCIDFKTTDGREYHTVCRRDGRCASDTLEVVIKAAPSEMIYMNTSFYSDVCKFTVDWGNGMTHSINNCSELAQAQIVSFYADEADGDLRTVRVTGEYNNIGISQLFKAASDNGDRVVAVNSFGTFGIKDYAFLGTNQMSFERLVDIPDAAKLMSMNGMFKDSKFNQNIENWDISYVRSMNDMFINATEFNQPLDKWDTSSVTSMIQSFRSASAFNQSLNGWDTSNVTTMDGMFFDAIAFDQDLSNWDVSKVKDYADMFCDSGMSENTKQKMSVSWAAKNSSMSSEMDVMCLK